MTDFFDLVGLYLGNGLQIVGHPALIHGERLIMVALIHEKRLIMAHVEISWDQDQLVEFYLGDGLEMIIDC